MNTSRLGQLEIDSDLYRECVTVASWFIESQTKHLPVVLIPRNRFPEGLKGINPTECPGFEVRPYDGPIVLAIPVE